MMMMPGAWARRKWPLAGAHAGVRCPARAVPMHAEREDAKTNEITTTANITWVSHHSASATPFLSLKWFFPNKITSTSHHTKLPQETQQAQPAIAIFPLPPELPIIRTMQHPMH
eukprot:TRINITY_DN72001_c0_g1_i1.p2 TRINITY_DN72001_c0_g1~~TRINITY_DN72001_c0_g1_i1.p2  ORF type:complete len:114 (-),score=9.84 TRINITY_DN72001_c0_g1_i1:448-789(-)